GECAGARRRDREQAPGDPLRLRTSRRDEPFRFQAVESRVHRPDGQLAARHVLDLAADGHAVGLAARAKHGEQDLLLERPERGLVARGPLHSALSTRAGFARLARTAGISVATIPTASSTSAAPPSAIGSVAP